MWSDLALITIGAFLAAMITGSVGFAFAIVVAAIWIHVLPPVEVVLLASICATLLHTASVWHFRREIEYRLLWPFVVGALFGVPLGVFGLRYMNADAFRHVFGAFIIVYGAYMLRRPKLPLLRLNPMAARCADGFVGWISGVMGGLAMLHGMLPTVWCGLRGWGKRRSRFVYQPYILFTGILVMLLVGLNVEIEARRFGMYLIACLPAIGAGFWVGVKTFEWISEDLFQRLVLWLIVASGIPLLFWGL